FHYRFPVTVTDQSQIAVDPVVVLFKNSINFDSRSPKPFNQT
ncbi:MAG: hypothetical protein ACI9MF_001015, partial [Gammaproteobacteria bacterium]